MAVSAPSRLITIHGEAHFNPDYILWLERRLAAYENLRAASDWWAKKATAEGRAAVVDALAALDRLDQEKP